MPVVKIYFEATMKGGKKKIVSQDTIRVSLVDPGRAEEIFIDWANTVSAIRGDSGIFHPGIAHGGAYTFKKYTLES